MSLRHSDVPAIWLDRHTWLGDRPGNHSAYKSPTRFGATQPVHHMRARAGRPRHLTRTPVP